MKKMITLIASMALVTGIFAQHHEGRFDDNTGSHRDVAYNDNVRYRNNAKFEKLRRERDMKIAKINRMYDRKIADVNGRWFTSRSKKQAIIWSLEDQRRHDIRRVVQQYQFAGRDRRNSW